MTCRLICTLLLAAAFSRPAAAQQEISQLPAMSSDEAIARTLKSSSLTAGSTPFHVVLNVTGPDDRYSGRIEVSWQGPQQYRLVVDSPSFRLQRTMNLKQTQEQITGDFYPRWLEDFVAALLDPASLVTNFQHRQQAVLLGTGGGSCLTRDDRPGNITDQMTWGILCFSGSEPLLKSVLTFNHNVDFSDYKAFAGQQIARTYTTNVLDYRPVTAHVVTLETLKTSDAALLTITTPTPAADLLTTQFIPTYQAAGMLDIEPKIDWPATQEGRTDGYMIIYVRTDRTGQVRESAKHNSDNARLEQFGMEQALRFKFKPLLVAGVPQQMELPMVLHFTSRISNPLPELTDEQTRARISGCTLPKVKDGQVPFRVRVYVSPTGHLDGEDYPDANTPGLPHHSSASGFSLSECHFAPLTVNGQTTYFHGMLLLP